MTTDDSAQNSNGGQSDDLTAIKGIGPARQEWLIKVFDVRTFSDLSALSVDQIETKLKAEGRLMVARPEIHEWIAQARELAATSEVAEPATQEADKTSNAPATPEWKPFASFVVEYQERKTEGQAEEYRTKVHHVEADAGETWVGLDGEALCQWMLAQLDKKAQQEPEEPERAEEPEEERAEALPAEAPPAPESDVAIQITQVQIRQGTGSEEPMNIGRPGQISPSFLRRDEPFGIDVSFDLVGSDEAAMARRGTPFHCEFYLRDLATGAALHLGNSRRGTLIEDKSTYTATLHSANLPKGTYQLQALVLLLGDPPIPGYIHVPMIQVS